MDDLTRIQTINRTPLALRSDKTGELHKLAGEMLVGREVECDIQLAFKQISRYHAKIYVSANGVFIEDLRSSNGTYLNGKKIRARVQVSLGDQLAFDDLMFRVTTLRSSDADQTQMATSQNLSLESVEEINRISADKLKPAPVVSEEQGREFKQPDVPVVRSADDANSDSPRTPKVHDITDMEEFLRVAGAGLSPQKPASGQKSNPFGLRGRQVAPEIKTDEIGANRKVAGETVKEYQDGNRNEIAATSYPAEPSPHPNISENIPHDAVPDGLPLEASELNRVLTPITPQRVVRRSSPDVDEDRTHFVSLNTMDRYAETNERYNNDLNVGQGPRLIAMTAPIRGKVFPLECSDDVKCWSIGRDDSADVCLRDQAVSREHAWITKLDALYQLRVNENAGDILVNGETVTEVDLQHGDRLQFGAMEIVFRLDVPEEDILVIPGIGKSWLSRCFQSFFSR